MRTLRVCCCTPTPSGPTRWWVECAGKRAERWDECGEPFHYMALFDENTSQGQALYNQYFGGVPNANTVWKISGQPPFNTGGLFAQCGEIKTSGTHPGRRELAFTDFQSSNGAFTSKTGCNDHDCKTFYELRPCGYPFSQEVSNPPEIYIATDDYWESVLTGGMPFAGAIKPGECPDVDLQNIYVVDITGVDNYCATLLPAFPTAQEAAQAQPPGGSTTYTRIDNTTNTGICGCEAPDCLDLFIFDPCPDSPAAAFSMAATASDWQSILNLPQKPDASSAATYTGVWKFKRLNPGGSEYGCCNSPGGNLSDYTPEFCGSLRPRTTQDAPDDFCFGPGALCSDDPTVGCFKTGDIGNRIQIIRANPGGSSPAGSLAAWFTKLDQPPTGTACDRPECTDCFSVNCGDGNVKVQGEFIFDYAFSKTHAAVRDLAPRRSTAGSVSHRVSYRIKYTAEMVFTDGDVLCGSGTNCSGPIDTSQKIIIGRWTPKTNGITINSISLSGNNSHNLQASFPDTNTEDDFIKEITYVAPTGPGETVNGTSTYPAIELELQKRYGLRSDVGGDDDATAVVCSTSLNECFTTCRANLSWTPKLVWYGSNSSTAANPQTNTASGTGVSTQLGFEMVKVVGSADGVGCCEADPQAFNGTIIWADCATRLTGGVFLDEITQQFDSEILGTVGSPGVYNLASSSEQGPCSQGATDTTEVWPDCGNWNYPESTATGGAWCDGYTAGKQVWAVGLNSGGQISPTALYNVTNTLQYEVSCTMDHQINSIECM